MRGTGVGSLPVVLFAALACAGDEAVAPWRQLISRSWTVPGNSEAFFCTRVQLTGDWYITGFRGVIPTGQDEVIVTASSQVQPTGDFDCNGGDLQFDPRLLWAAGRGTGEILFPAGVGVVIAEGQFVALRVHVANLSAAPLTGTSTLDGRAAGPTDVATEADLTFAGQLSFAIPADSAGYEVTGGCTLPFGFSVFALFPTMRGLGTHLTVERVAPGGGTVQVLHDSPFTAVNQPFYVLASPTTLSANDRVDVTCTYTNPSMQAVPAGDYLNEEKCLVGLYRYPRPSVSGVLGCTSGLAATYHPAFSTSATRVDLGIMNTNAPTMP